MPIANCLLRADCPEGAGNPVELWSGESRVEQTHMTINFSRSIEQFGNGYLVMAHLYLPSLWSENKVAELQLGLAKAIQQYFNIQIEQIHVITSIVHSGSVVEHGQIQQW